MNTWQNTVKRALKTFFQAAVAYLVTALGGGLSGLFDAEGNISKTVVVGLILSAIAAGLAALMNLPDHGTSTVGVEIIEGASIVKREDDCLEDIPMAGQIPLEGDKGDE